MELPPKKFETAWILVSGYRKQSTLRDALETTIRGYSRLNRARTVDFGLRSETSFILKANNPRCGCNCEL